MTMEVFVRLFVIGIFFTKTELSECQVRLAGSARTYMGRVEVQSGNMWYRVCDYDWDIQEADVVCKELGFPGGAMFSSVSPRADFGSNENEPLGWNNYNCTGSESNFKEECIPDGVTIESNDCDDVAVICNVPSYRGCYGIAEDEYPPGLKRVSTATGSIHVCLEVCRPHSIYGALGLRDDQIRCYCFSGDYTQLSSLSNDHCNNKCNEDDRQGCGGLNAYSIYPVSVGEPGNANIDTEIGFIYSPKFFGKYQAGMNNIWVLSFANQKTVTLDLKMYLLDSFDSLEVSDGSSTMIFDSVGQWTSNPTMSVTLELTTADNSNGNYGFYVEYTSSDASEAMSTIRPATTKSTTRVITIPIAPITTEMGDPATTRDLPITMPVTTASIDTTTEASTTHAESPTTTDNPTMAIRTTVTDRPTTRKVTTERDRSTVMTSEPACPVRLGSNSISNQVSSNPTSELIIAKDMAFECDTLVTKISLYASAQSTYTFFVLRKLENEFRVISRIEITSDSPGVVEEDLTNEMTSFVGSIGDFVALSFESNSITYSMSHSMTSNFTVYETDSNFANVFVGDILDLTEGSSYSQREYPFRLTMRQAARCDLSTDPEGGMYSVTSLLESQSAMLTCLDGYNPKFNDDSNNDNTYINVTCNANGVLDVDGSCEKDKRNLTYLIIFTTVVACIGFCVILVSFAMLCSKTDETGDDIEKAPSDENVLLPIDDPEDDDYIDSPADEANEEDEAEDVQDNEKDEEDVQDNDKEVDDPSVDEQEGSQENDEQSNVASSTGDVGNVENPIYASNDAVNTEEWAPEEAGPDD